VADAAGRNVAAQALAQGLKLMCAEQPALLAAVRDSLSQLADARVVGVLDLL
jgi:hypothetical protein